MIPSNEFTILPQMSAFRSPNDKPYFPLVQTVYGGTNIGDSALGRKVKNWVVFYQNGQINVRPESSITNTFSLTMADVKSVSLAFDASMNIALAWTTSTGAKLYTYDPAQSMYTTRTYPGVTSCRVCVDNIEDFYTASSDVIFAYTLNNVLYYRQQRDDYNVERTIGATAYTLVKVGQNVENRLQFELVDNIQSIPSAKEIKPNLKLDALQSYSFYYPNDTVKMPIQVSGGIPIIPTISAMSINITDGANTFKQPGIFQPNADAYASGNNYGNIVNNAYYVAGYVDEGIGATGIQIPYTLPVKIHPNVNAFMQPTLVVVPVNNINANTLSNRKVAQLGVIIQETFTMTWGNVDLTWQDASAVWP